MASKALLLGINNYQWISDLRGCENDGRNVARLLTNTFGFHESQIRQHVSQEVTKATITDGFAWLFDGARNGDRLVVHFSGHGSYIESASSDEAIDELICLYDMDIENPNTYLLDDELGRLTADLPDGARLTIILDTCHSGTGTRRLAPTRGAADAPLLVTKDTAKRAADHNGPALERELSRGDAAPLAALARDERNLVYARVYEYDAALSARKSSSPIRKFGQSLVSRSSGSLNHQLLAAAADSQTAADAYIENDFHGAFTYHLCQAARELSATSTTQAVMDTAIGAIHGAGFLQTPQNEGPFEDDALFGPITMSEAEGQGDAATDGPTTPTQPTRPGTAAVTSADSAQSGADLLADIVRVAEKFIDLADYLVREAPDRVGARPTVARVGAEYVVYTHGISQHQEGYSVPWWNALTPHLDRSLERAEVLWSPVVNPRGLRMSPRPRSAAEQDFAQQLERLLDDRQQQLLSTVPDASRSVSTMPSVSERSLDFAIDDFTRYMLNQDEREEILTIFDETVRPLLESGATVHLVSHSWGSVVAWEGLRRLDDESFAGRVVNLFVVGSALSLWPVQTNLFERITDGRRPTVVDRVFNLNARGDIVGGPIGRNFDVNDEFLGLDAQGCSLFNVGCSHVSYFQANNLVVNRDIFGLLINTQ